MNDKPQLFVDGCHFDVIQWKKCLWFVAMFLHVSQAGLHRRFSLDHNGIHVATENFSDCHLKAFVRRLTQIDQTAVLKDISLLKRICSDPLNVPLRETV